ncbi:pentapeptide repeat-containing protein [Roseofilum sp. BLCC_M154]|uniref:Pentapeptide repeat-containing protein n=1 Tax=Roseofilum acuticapitatum BLCC-M154 TaxID=3022444 RepID=A0ABT7AVF8_9CYAN|nr:pentapeptide repeat-containing protein [Roseofilum acuticapitatum]MDJ1170897.1 pentapeptide repeat-containing protein [Roseofilum acuticapitatum BLCC-M154]
MADEMAQYHSQVDGEIKGLSIGTGNVIYNYFYSHPKASTNEDVTETDSLRCPYRGLFHFSPKDAEYFFGRDDFIKELYQATQTRNFIPVLGASGSGKSSVVFAGLVPKLQAEGSWQFTYFRPGVIRKQDKQEIADPFYALATALVPLYTPDLNKTEQLAQGNTLADLLRRGEVLLSDVIATIQDNYPGDRLLLIADQFEELYTVCTDRKIRDRFLDILIDNIYTPSSDSPLVLVLTMRADFLGNALSYASFAQVLDDDLKLGAMNDTQLREVIENPAQKLGITFEPGLVKTILEDLENEPGNLPLLEFTLTELWKQRTGKQITLNDYRAIGTVKGALARYADGILDDPNWNPEQIKTAQRIFLKLVNPGEDERDTRKPVMKADLNPSEWNFVNRLADKRLVVTGQNSNQEYIVEIVHEVLIDRWPRLRNWVDENREIMLRGKTLEMQAKEWEKAAKNKDYLLQGEQLKNAQYFQDKYNDIFVFSKLAEDFLNESREEIKIAREIESYANEWDRNGRTKDWLLSSNELAYLKSKLSQFQLANREVEVSNLAKNFIKKSEKYDISFQKKNTIILRLFTFFTLMIATHTFIIESANSKISEVNCKRDLTHLSIRYLLWFSRFGNQRDWANKNFCKEDFSGIDFSNHRLKLDSADFSDAILHNVRFRQGSLFKEVDFENTDFNLAILEDAVFIDSNLNGANMTNAILANAKFIDTTLQATSFSGTTLDRAIFIRSDLLNSTNLTEDIVDKIISGNIKICHSELPSNINVPPNRDCEDETVNRWR